MDRKVMDQMGNHIDVPIKVNRIVSLVPSQTELLFHLGLKDKIVGITKFCCHPKSAVANITKVGGTKTVKTDIVDLLKPDLVIANKEENDETQIDLLKSKHPVWVSDIFTLADALRMIQQVGELTSKIVEGHEATKAIEKAFDTLKPREPKRVLYVIWQKPIMVAASDTFIDDMISKCGWTNAAESLDRYPELTEEMIRSLNPDVFLLSSEPFPFKDKHIVQWEDKFGKPVHLVDGEYFSWYGSRLINAPSYFSSIDLG